VIEAERNASAEVWNRGMPMDSIAARFYEAGFTDGWDRHAALAAALAAQAGRC